MALEPQGHALTIFYSCAQFLETGKPWGWVHSYPLSIFRKLLIPLIEIYSFLNYPISGKFYDAIKAMYSNPRSKILLNEFETEFFDCPIGVKQGDNISATLFSIFINDLAEQIKDTKIGIYLNKNVQNDNCKTSSNDIFLNILLYADDICLMTTNENDLQFLLNIVENWCQKWRLEVNLTKTNVMHIRNPRCAQSRFVFLFNHRIVSYCKHYKYLGSTLDEFLNFDKTA